jgi:hypothetical protein
MMNRKGNENPLRESPEVLSVFSFLFHNQKARGVDNPCGGGVEYLHRDRASRKRRRNGTKKAAP